MLPTLMSILVTSYCQHCDIWLHFYVNWGYGEYKNFNFISYYFLAINIFCSIAIIFIVSKNVVKSYEMLESLSKKKSLCNREQLEIA